MKEIEFLELNPGNCHVKLTLFCLQNQEALCKFGECMLLRMLEVTEINYKGNFKLLSTSLTKSNTHVYNVVTNSTELHQHCNDMTPHTDMTYILRTL